MRFQTVSQAFSWIEGFANFEKRSGEPGEYRLDRMRAMLSQFGNPQNSCPAIHIAGSKGKGSTTRFCASILETAGYRTGIYASPHLFDYRERICRSNSFFSDETYLGVISRLREWLDEIETRMSWSFGTPTSFELLTLAAYLVFEQEKCEWIVVETGLGGRLDATNVMASRACLICALELEHTDVLGDTIELIAAEKAGIFRRNALLISSKQEPKARKILSEKAALLMTKIYSIEDNSVFARKTASPYKRATITMPRSEGHKEIEIEIKLCVAGEFQLNNATLAAHAIAGLWNRNELQRISSQAMLKVAIETGISATRIPGRMEKYTRFVDGKYQEVWLDVSHTPVSVDLAQKTFNPRSNDILLFGSVLGKRYEEMAAILGPLFSRIIISTPSNFKKSDPIQVHRAFSAHNASAALVENVDQAFTLMLNLLKVGNGNFAPRALVCGSFYLSGLIVEKLQSTGFKPGVDLCP